jgi:hypothetical protein
MDANYVGIANRQIVNIVVNFVQLPKVVEGILIDSGAFGNNVEAAFFSKFSWI